MVAHVPPRGVLLIDGPELDLRGTGPPAQRPPRTGPVPDGRDLSRGAPAEGAGRYGAGREGELFSTVAAVVARNREEIERRVPQPPPRGRGEHPHPLPRGPAGPLRPPWGSGGTLGHRPPGAPGRGSPPHPA